MSESADRPRDWLDDHVTALTEALLHAMEDPPYAQLDSNLTDRLIRRAFRDVIGVALSSGSEPWESDRSSQSTTKI